MYCSTDIATLVSYSSCVVCLISVYITTFASLDVCKRYNKCSECNEYVLSKSQSKQEQEEEYNEDVFICKVLEPFNLSDADAEQIYLACKSHSNKKEDKDVVLKKITTLLHWYFNEQEDEDNEQEEEQNQEQTNKKDE